MRWQIYHDFSQSTTTSPQEIVRAILAHRGVKTPDQIKTFLTIADPQTYSLSSVGLKKTIVDQAVSQIKHAVTHHRPIIVYGDYDADGITATAILWETLHQLKANAYPFIPSRESHGYGLSIHGLQDALKLVEDIPLIITVDNGIVAHNAAEWLKTQHVPLIITDHHTPSATYPLADCVVHSTHISGAGVAWFVARALLSHHAQSTLDLVAIGTIADMMPLTTINRSFAAFGLQALAQTKRPGLKELLAQADVDLTQPLTSYHVNYIIAPRLNAMGRLEHALDSLRLLCTRNVERAYVLASKLGETNRMRQDLTLDLLNRANNHLDPENLNPVIVVEDTDFHEGIIGLIAGKLAETYHRPAIVISKKDGVSKGSARSIKGVNITKLIRSQSHLLLGVGGHPMAAGFSIETNKIPQFKNALTQFALNTIDDTLFDPVLDIDCALNGSKITLELYQAIKQLEPFGIGNPQPTFALLGAKVISIQTLGKNGNHKKIRINCQGDLPLEVLWFNAPASSDELHAGSIIDVVGTLSLNIWKNRSSIQLLASDLRIN